MKLLMLKGLPASGKSTFARQLVDGHDYVRANKDEIRTMLHNGKWSKRNEKEVLAVRDFIVEYGLALGRNVVVDDTGFNPTHEDRLRELAKEHGAQFEVKFFDTPLEECIKRDLGRPNSVGERVIRQMYNQYLKPKVEPAAYEPGLPEAVICDIDGTLAHMVDRGPFDWDRVGEDELDWAVASILDGARKQGVPIILMSGRDSVCRSETEQWLYEHGIKYEHLFMRPEGDTRKDAIVKRELYEQHVKGKYNVRYVLDDRNQVVELWRSLGLKTLQVAEGDF